MTMMSIESIELDKQSEADGGANNFFDKQKIEEEYQKQINSFVEEYEKSPLRNDCDEVFSGLNEID